MFSGLEHAPRQVQSSNSGGILCTEVIRTVVLLIIFVEKVQKMIQWLKAPMRQVHDPEVKPLLCQYALR